MEEMSPKTTESVTENIRKASKKAALKQLKNRWMAACLPCIVIYAVMFISMIPALCGVYRIGTGHTNLVNFFIGYAISMLIFLLALPVFHYTYILHLADYAKFSEKITFANFMSKFDDWKKAHKVFWYFVLKYLIKYLIYCGPVIVLMTITELSENTGLKMILDFIIFPVSIFSFVMIMRVLLSMFPYYYIIAENNDMSVKEAMELSKNISKNNLLEILVFLFSFIGWSFLCYLTMGIGIIWLIPYCTLAGYNFVLKLREKYEAAN